MSLDHHSYELPSKSMHVQPVPAPSFKIAIARQGNSVLKEEFKGRNLPCAVRFTRVMGYIFLQRRKDWGLMRARLARLRAMIQG